MSLAQRELAQFLIDAKKLTYAAGGAQSALAVPSMLAGSHQLEYRQGSLLYRDVYFGEARFAGIEVVYDHESPFWSMCYGGGWTSSMAGRTDTGRLARVLQAALRSVPLESPYRGPAEFSDPPYLYRNEPSGHLLRFQGREWIESQGQILYQLSYLGGSLG